MSIITVVDAKSQLNIMHDDDVLIESKIAAAQAHLEQLLGYQIEEEFETIPEDLKEAVRHLVGASGRSSYDDAPDDMSLFVL